MKNTRGFSLVEALVAFGVIAVIGLLAALAVGSARSTSRDAVRLSNVRQIQVVMEQYFQNSSNYPAGDALPLGDMVESSCLGSGGFASSCSGMDTIYLRSVPGTLETGLSGQVVCGTPLRQAFCYSQKESGKAYSLSFELEHDIPYTDLKKGSNCALPEGLRPGLCP